MSSVNMRAPGQVIAGRYRLERPLGAGGMGSVWVAVHVELESRLAIKFQHVAGTSASADARFRREAKAAAQLRSPHVVHIYDYGFDDGIPFIAMELIAGDSLQERLERERQIPITETAEFVRQAAIALDVAHEQGVIHRDIKPANLFIARQGNHQTIKLLDFGIAKWTDGDQQQSRDMTDSAVLVGSVAYMSPEQARGAKVDHRTDLWSLGVVVYQMVTGISPFQGANIPDSLRRICSGIWDRPSKIFGPVYKELDLFLERALCEQPEGRFRSAGELADELTRCVGRIARPDAAGRASGTASMTIGAAAAATTTVDGEAFRPAARRRRSFMLYAAGAGLALVAGIGVIGLSMRAHSRQPPPPRPAGLAPQRAPAPPSGNATVAPIAPVAPLAAPAAHTTHDDRAPSHAAAVQRHASRATVRTTPAPPSGRGKADPKADPKVDPNVDPIFGIKVAPSP